MTQWRWTRTRRRAKASYIGRANNARTFLLGPDRGPDFPATYNRDSDTIDRVPPSISSH